MSVIINNSKMSLANRTGAAVIKKTGEPYARPPSNTSSTASARAMVRVAQLIFMLNNNRRVLVRPRCARFSIS